MQYENQATNLTCICKYVLGYHFVHSATILNTEDTLKPCKI